MKIFSDKKAQRLFINIYETLDTKKQKVLGMKIRALAKEKIISDGNDFYITEKDVINIYQTMK